MTGADSLPVPPGAPQDRVPHFPGEKAASLSFSAVLLAGGKSTRMGRDKSELRIGGVPLWQRQLATLRAIHPAVIFISGPARLAWSRECEVLADAVPDAGPLGGVAAALRRCRTGLLVVLAVDLPRMTADFLRALAELAVSERRGVIPVRADFFEPLAAIYPVGSGDLAAECLRSGQRSLQHFAEAALARGILLRRPVAPAEEPLFWNVNTPEEFRAAVELPSEVGSSREANSG